MLAALAQHNYLPLTSNAMYTSSDFVDSESGDGSIPLREWRNRDVAQSFNNVRSIRGNRNRLEVVQMRNEIREFLNSGKRGLPWQQDYIQRTYRNNNTSGAQPEGGEGFGRVQTLALKRFVP